MGEPDSTKPEVVWDYKSQKIPFTGESGNNYFLNLTERYRSTKEGGITTRVVTAIFESGKRIRITDEEYVLTNRRKFNQGTFIDKAEKDGIRRDLAEKVLAFLKEDRNSSRQPQLMLKFD